VADFSRDTVVERHRDLYAAVMDRSAALSHQPDRATALDDVG
jgi:hypothetical protein